MIFSICSLSCPLIFSSGLNRWYFEICIYDAIAIFNILIIVEECDYCPHAKIYLLRQPCIHLLSDLYHCSPNSLRYPYHLLIILLIYLFTRAFSLRLTPLLCKETISVRDGVRMDLARLGRQIPAGFSRECSQARGRRGGVGKTWQWGEKDKGKERCCM